MQYIITTKDPGKNSGGNKAKKDIDFFAHQIDDTGILTIPLYQSRMKRFLLTKHMVSSIIKKHPAEKYILQYPTQYEKATIQIIKTIQNETNSEIDLVVHDIPGFQFNQNNWRTERLLFNSVGGLIIHNDSMKQWLKSHGVNTKMINLGLFDYDNEQPLQKKHKYEESVCFPGNLSKSVFLTKLSLRHSINIYGPNKLSYYPSCVKYCGEYTPEELPKHLHEDFGLIWDGNDTGTCNGPFGEYLKINNPHKVSLYLSSGIPVIIWKKAALANFIEENGLGITINSLSELDNALSSMSNDSYQIMKQNAENIGLKLRRGFYIKNAIKMLDEA